MPILKRYNYLLAKKNGVPKPMKIGTHEFSTQGNAAVALGRCTAFFRLMRAWPGMEETFLKDVARYMREHPDADDGRAENGTYLDS